MFATGLAADATLIFGMAAGLGTFLWAVSISVLRHGALPKWLGWLTLALAIAAVTPIGFFVFLAMLI